MRKERKTTLTVKRHDNYRLIDQRTDVKHQYKQKQATFKDISFSYTYHYLGH